MPMGAVCPRKVQLQRQGFADDNSVASVMTLRAWVPVWVKQSDSSTSAAAARPRLRPLFSLQEPFPPLLCLFICLLGCPYKHFEHFEHVVIPGALLFAYVDWTSICLTTIAALSLVAMSCQLLGGRRKWAIVRMILSCQLEQRSWVAPHSLFVLAFWFFPVLETARHFQNVFAFKEWGAAVYLDKKCLVKFSANQTNICICSYRACCGKGKIICLQRHGGVCLHIVTGCPHFSRCLSQKASDKQSFCTGVGGHHWLWMVLSVTSHFERAAALCNSLP